MEGVPRAPGTRGQQLARQRQRPVILLLAPTVEVSVDADGVRVRSARRHGSGIADPEDLPAGLRPLLSRRELTRAAGQWTGIGDRVSGRRAGGSVAGGERSRRRRRVPRCTCRAPATGPSEPTGRSLWRADGLRDPSLPGGLGTASAQQPEADREHRHDRDQQERALARAAARPRTSPTSTATAGIAASSVVCER